VTKGRFIKGNIIGCKSKHIVQLFPESLTSGLHYKQVPEKLQRFYKKVLPKLVHLPNMREGGGTVKKGRWIRLYIFSE
jgi:hypothetical protein